MKILFAMQKDFCEENATFELSRQLATLNMIKSKI